MIETIDGHMYEVKRDKDGNITSQVGVEPLQALPPVFDSNANQLIQNIISKDPALFTTDDFAVCFKFILRALRAILNR